MPVSPLLTISDFTCQRGGRLLFEKLSFMLCSGEALVLKGPNGSGKTSLLRCLAGIPVPYPNISKVQGVSQSYVGHANALKLSLTVRQNLERQMESCLESSLPLLEKTGLIPLLDQEIRTLSMGQRRETALARLALSKSRLWIVDEPTTHLDTQATDRFWGLVEVHLEAGGAAVISSHVPVPLPGIETLKLL